MRRAPGASRESLFPAPGGVSATGRAVGGGKTRRATRRRTVCRLDRSGPGGGVPMAMQCSPAPGRAFFRVNSGSGGTSPAAAWPGIAPGERRRAGGRAAATCFPASACARSRTTCTQAHQRVPGRARWRRLGRIRFAVDGRGAGLLSPRSRSCPPQRRGPHARLAGRTTAIGLAHAASADPGTTAQRGGRRCSCRPDGGGAGVSARAGARPGPARAARGRVGPAAAAIAHAAYRHGGRHDRAAHRRGGPPDQRQKLMKPVMIRALEKSMKNAPTRGATRKARGATP